MSNYELVCPSTFSLSFVEGERVLHSTSLRRTRSWVGLRARSLSHQFLLSPRSQQYSLYSTGLRHNGSWVGLWARRFNNLLSLFEGHSTPLYWSDAKSWVDLWAHSLLEGYSTPLYWSQTHRVVGRTKE